MIDNGAYELAPVVPIINESVGEYVSDFVDSFIYNITRGGKEDFEKLKPMLLKKAEKANDMDRIRYLRQDLNLAKRQLGKLADNVQSVMDGNPKKNLNVKHLQKQINKGLTPDSIKAYIKWLETDYAKALNARAKALKEPKNEAAITNESVSAARHIFYRMSESEMFQNANRMAKINNEELFNILPRMVVDGEGFAQLDLNDLDPTVVYELFESNRFRISCKKAMKMLLSSGKVVMVYGDEYRIPTCVPYLIQATKNGARVFVNITPFTSINQYGKVRVTQIRNYSGLMAVLFAACVAYAIARGNMDLPADLCDGLVLFYAGMMTKVINSLVHADSIQKETCKYLCSEFALVQMYGTEHGTTVFQRFKNKYFPKLGKLVVNSIDDTFHIDSFDNMTLFVEELKRNYPIMKSLTVSAISEKWMRNFGSATALSLDYIGFHIYNLCMLLFESPLVSRMALEPLIDQKRGTDAFKRMQIMIEQSV